VTAAVLTEPKVAGVVGAGTMGAGIAQVCATAGLSVILVDVGMKQLERGKRIIADSLAKFEERRKLPHPVAEISGRIRTSTDVRDLGAAEVVIEAASEDTKIKLDLFRRLDQVCPPGAILASNTSSISLTRIGGATKRADRVVGMHFMNPAPVMPLVEIVRAIATTDEVVEAIRALSVRFGKTPVVTKDSPGFLANRILVPMLNEACFAFEEGLGTREDIDTVMRLGMSHPMGPLALADFIGLDVLLGVLEVFQRDLGDPKYRPAPILRRYVDAGWLGRKTGRGFYEYPTGTVA